MEDGSKINSMKAKGNVSKVCLKSEEDGIEKQAVCKKP